MQPVRRRLGLDPPFADVTLGYLDWNEGAERTVVCVHGLTRNAHDFDVLAARLAAAGVRVVAFDVAGRGHSSWLRDPAAYAVPTYAGHLVGALRLLGLERVDWVGTSMGGLIGMVLAASEISPIERLVLNDIGAVVPRAALMGIKDYLDLQPTFGTFAELEAHLRLIHAPFGPLTDAQWQALARSSARHDPDGWRLRYDPAIRFAYAELAEDDVELWSLWDAIRAPTFVLRGADSIVLPADVAEAMRTRGPKAVVETVVGVGHAPALMDPQQVETVAGWLDLAG